MWALRLRQRAENYALSVLVESLRQSLLEYDRLVDECSFCSSVLAEGKLWWQILVCAQHVLLRWALLHQHVHFRRKDRIDSCLLLASFVRVWRGGFLLPG